MVTKCKNGGGILSNTRLKGFTLVELLAVIVILAIIALVAVPIILNVVNDAKRNALKDSVYSLTQAAENYVFMEEARGKKINWNTNKITNEQYVSFNLSNEEDVKKLNVKGIVPNKGRVEITKKGDTFVVAIDDNVCAKKNYGETLVNLLSLNSDDICMLTASSDDLSSDDANDIIATITNLSGRVEELENKNSTLEEKVNTIQGETIDKIYPVGSIYISTDLNTVDKVEDKFGGKWEVYGNGKVLRGTTGTSGETGGLENVQLSQANLPEHSHSYTPTGKVSSTFTGSSATTNSKGAHEHTTSGTAASSGGHTHNVTAKGSISSSFSGKAVTSGSTGSGYTISHTYSGRTTSSNVAINTNEIYTYQNGGTKHFYPLAWNGAYVGVDAQYQEKTRHSHTYNDYYANKISGVEAHTHSVTAAGTVSSTFTGSSVATTSAGAHTHSVSGTAAESGAHTHTVTAKGTVSSTFTGTASSTNNTGSNAPFSVLDPYITVYMYKRVK